MCLCCKKWVDVDKKNNIISSMREGNWAQFQFSVVIVDDVPAHGF